MFSDLRFVKFATEGALGIKTPTSYSEAIKKVAFTAGLLSTIELGRDLSFDETKVVADLVAATKLAQDLTTRLRNRLRVKTASAGYDSSLRAIAVACYSGQFKKTGAAPNAAGGIAESMFDTNSKMAKAVELLGVDEVTLRALTGGKQTAGFTAGVLGLVA